MMTRSSASDTRTLELVSGCTSVWYIICPLVRYSTIFGINLVQNSILMLQPVPTQKTEYQMLYRNIHVLHSALRETLDVDSDTIDDVERLIVDMACNTVVRLRDLCRVWIETKGDMEVPVRDEKQRMLSACKPPFGFAAQVCIARCTRYMDGFLTHTRRSREEWSDITSGVLWNLRTWFETTGNAMVRERVTASRTNLYNDLFIEYYNTMYVEYMEGIEHDLCDYEMQLILECIVTNVETIVDGVVFDIDTERSEQHARELLEEVEREDVPVRVSKNKRRKARRRAEERVSTEREDCTRPNVEEITDALRAVCTAEDEAKLCVVCMDATRTHLIAPCGHKCLCESCSTTFGTMCPICRTDAMLVCRVFDC